jgi:beta-N-acetylhexosaminidase
LNKTKGEQTSLAERKRRAGQRLVIGIYGKSLTDDARRLVRAIRPAGFILFRRNVEDPAQVLDFNKELIDLCGSDLPPLLTIDQEGGRVQRVRAPATEWPTMRALGDVPEHIEAISTGLANEVRAMGFNLNFAPDADVDSNPDNPVIGDRSFGRDPATVAKHVARFIRAHQAAGVIACAKHFPGHGDTNTDSHHELPWVHRDAQGLDDIELPPFRASIDAGVGSVMTSHVMFPAWDERWPATLSPRIMRDILRKKLGYDGVVFTDDLDMKAVSERYTTHDKVRQTLLGGVDLSLACHSIDLQIGLYEEAVRLQEDHGDLDAMAKESFKRMQILRDRFLTQQPPAPRLSVVGCQRHLDLARHVTEQAARHTLS